MCAPVMNTKFESRSLTQNRPLTGIRRARKQHVAQILVVIWKYCIKYYALDLLRLVISTVKVEVSSFMSSIR